MTATQQPIERLLVANRGEIARRVFATCRRLGIETVAVHSDADAGMPFVAEADTAVALPGNTPAETYLDAAAVIAAAQRAGADAIHPGYGFLSENADFARAVEAAGLVWVGPTPESITAMGSKIGAKRLMKEAGVPVLEAPESPTEADLPLLVKASAGGGGRGMRVVRDLSALDSEVAAAAAEAASAFGDGTVFVEPYVERGRHVEVQVVGDGRGGVLVLGERDCSVQRRHQKVVEEAPAPGLSEATRTALHTAAHDAAAAIGYRGAGTVEFLYDPATERFFFLEMNTRLQVEHPVTELVHDVDLVELQIAVAEGHDLPAHQDDHPAGHAVEVRLYAEDPASAYQPQSGALVTFEIDADAQFGPLPRAGVRVDSGVGSGDAVSTFYDAMLAKVISWAPTRQQAVRQLARALRRARIHGLTTNRDQLLAILADPTFVAGEMTTALLEDGALTGARESDPVAACVAAVALAERERACRSVQQGVPVAWRNVVSQAQVTALRDGADEIAVRWLGGRTGYHFPGQDLEVLSAGEQRVLVRAGGVETAYDVLVSGGRVHVDHPRGSQSFEIVPRFTDPAAQLASGSLVAPMPGAVVSVAVAAGDRVESGATILVLEAMKMQHTVTAPASGTVTEITVQPGSQVAAGDVMAVVEEDQ